MSQILGTAMDRVDGRAKVTGEARYAADQQVPDLTHAVLVTSTIAAGRIAAIDTRAAESAQGVLMVLTARNAPSMAAVPKPPWPFGQSMMPLRDDVIHHDGQIVAVVVADTLEHGQHAASLLGIRYAPRQPRISMARHLADAVTPPSAGGPEHTYRRGRPEAAFTAAPIQLDATFTTSMQHHNAMEPSSTTAVWDGEKLTLYETTQSVTWTRTQVAALLGIPADNVRVLSPYLGGGFGCKGYVWPHTVLIAAVARQLGRPVKLVLTRAQTYTLHGHRSQTVQRFRLGADRDGRLRALMHATTSQTSPFDDVAWEETKGTAYLYQCPNVSVDTQVVRLNVGNPTPMRAPSGVGGFVLEAMLDELSYAAGVDPIDLRLRNYSQTDQRDGTPWGTRKFLADCYERGAALFGWRRARPQPGTMRRDGKLIGWGMATAFHPVYSSAAEVSVQIGTDAIAVVRSATQDIGTGVRTVVTQVTAQALGVTPAQVRFELGDSAFPPGAPSAGSRTAVSVGGAAHQAGLAARVQVIAAAVADRESRLYGLKLDDITVADGTLVYRHDPRRTDTYARVLAQRGRPVDATGATTATTSTHAYGAVFAEVHVDEATRETRVTRLVGAFDAGRILNPKTAGSQATGGMIWGLGTALTEQTVLDDSSGRVLTANLSGYLVPVSADVPSLTVEFVDKADPAAGALGARGNGELAPNGTTAAIANAVYHATGRRIRDLPITPDRLL